MAKLYTGEPNFLSPVVDPVERWILSVAGADSGEEMDWKMFAVAMMIFSVIGIAVVFVLQLVQQCLPLNPAGVGRPLGPLAQYRGQFRHEHQLAGICR